MDLNRDDRLNPEAIISDSYPWRNCHFNQLGNRFLISRADYNMNLLTCSNTSM